MDDYYATTKAAADVTRAAEAALSDAVRRIDPALWARLAPAFHRLQDAIIAERIASREAALRAVAPGAAALLASIRADVRAGLRGEVA